MATLYNPRIVTDGLVLCLDAANAKSYPGSGTTWYDLSGNGNNGTLVNGPTFNSDNNGFLGFDFTNDVVEISDANSLSFIDNIFTFNFWVNFNAVNVTQGVIGKRGWEYSIHTTGSNILYFYCWNTSGSIVYVLSSTIEENKWYNFVFTADGTTSYLYRNGLFIGSGAKSGNNMGNTTAILTVGRGGQSSTGNAFLNGKISSVMFYSSFFNLQEVQQNFQALRGRYGI